MDGRGVRISKQSICRLKSTLHRNCFGRGHDGGIAICYQTKCVFCVAVPQGQRASEELAKKLDFLKVKNITKITPSTVSGAEMMFCVLSCWRINTYIQNTQDSATKSFSKIHKFKVVPEMN